MNDVDEQLHSEQRETVPSNVEDREVDRDESDNENGAAATPFDIGFTDPEERALLDMLDSEGRSTNESILSKDFLSFPSLASAASRMAQMPSRVRSSSRSNTEFLRAFFEEESMGSNEDDSHASLLDIFEEKDPPNAPGSGSAIESLVKKAVAGK